MTPLTTDAITEFGASAVAHFLLRESVETLEEALESVYRGDEERLWEALWDASEEYAEEHGAFGVGA